MPAKLELIQAEARFAVANWGRYNLMVWRTEISALGVSIWARAIQQLKQTNPGLRLGQVTWIESECVFLQDSSAFPACVEALKRFSDCLAGSAVVYAREGFWNATMRSRVTAIHSESKTEVPFALRPTLEEAHGWLREQAPDLPGVSVAGLAGAMQELRTKK
ncbi:MAG TPA: hypothetical protein VFZ61_08090 [Polyangiales bacterium]